jgi:hypothetical protein
MAWQKSAKLVILSLIIFVLFPFSLSPKIFAQASSSTAAQGWFCAKTTWCRDKNANCTSPGAHRVKLEIDSRYPLQPNINETYLVECLSYSKNNQLKWVCTTGDNNIDQQAFRANNFTQLQADVGYSLTHNDSYGIYKVVNGQASKIGSKIYKTGPSGGLIIKDTTEPASLFEWQSYTPQRHDRKFYFMQKIPQSNNPDVGSGGQQQATSFDWVNADQDCAVVRWDPAGRVFDAYSLEPIPNATVLLTVEKTPGSFEVFNEFGVVNPQLTNSQGDFFYFVPNGNYKLSAQASDYQRIATSTSEINSKYGRIYFYEENQVKKTYIYPAETGEMIEQRGKIEYRDIPLIPNSVYPQGKNHALVVISGFRTVDRITGNIIFEGTVSHPFTLVKIYGIETNGEKSLIYQGSADNLGHYKVIFPQKKDGQVFVNFEVDYQKVDLRLIAGNKSFLSNLFNSFLRKITVFAQESGAGQVVSINLDPIPTYIEGFAYDSQGKILANKQVAIYIEGSNTPYLTVTTDSNGFYRLASNQLPSLPYYLKYQTNEGSFITVNTGKVINDNKNLLLTKKIDYYSLKNNKGESITVSPKISKAEIPPLKTSQVENQVRTAEKNTDQNESQTARSIILILVVIFVLVLITAVVVYFYWRQKKTSFDY